MARSTRRCSLACVRRRTLTRRTSGHALINCWPLGLNRISNSSMAFQAANPDINLTLIAPELIVGIAGVAIMLVDAFARRGQRWITGALSIAALVAATVTSVWLGTSSSAPPDAFNGMILLDELRLSFTLIFLIVSILTILIAMVWIEA